MSVFVVRALVQMREALSTHQELARKLDALESRLPQQLDQHESALRLVQEELKHLREPEAAPRREIAFHVRDELCEDAVRYRVTVRRRRRVRSTAAR